MGYDVTKHRQKDLRKTGLRIQAFTGESRKRFAKMTLTLLAAFLTFGGPTYLIYVVIRWGEPSVLLALLGRASLLTGLVLFMRLIEEAGKTRLLPKAFPLLLWSLIFHVSFCWPTLGRPFPSLPS